MSTLLQVRGLSKHYGDNPVLRGVDFDVAPRSVVSLVGENGAGKTTLFDILSGITPAAGGTVTLNGRPWQPASLKQAQAGGISRVFQEQSLIAPVPVYENLLLGRDRRFYRAGFLQRKAMITAARQLLEAAGLSLDVTRPVSDYSFSQRQTLEIARACLAPSLIDGIDLPLILLDEPTATLDQEDEQWFIRLVATLRQQASLLLVSHRLNEVLALSDSIYVLKDGQRVAACRPEEASESRLQQWMVGRERAEDHYFQQRQADVSDRPAVLEVRDLTLPGADASINLRIRRGEILGIGGLLNSGKNRLARGIAGIAAAASGEVRIDGGDWQRPVLQRLIRQGLGYIPAERLEEGIIAPFSVSWNISLASGADRFSNRAGLWRHQRERQTAQHYIESLRIRSATPEKSVAELSGGNQQKVVLGRWLYREPRVLILDNPTRGVDAGAKEDIYQQLRTLSERGVAILLLSDELLELIGLSHRIAILQHGRQVGEIPAPANDKPDEQTLVAMMLNATSASPDRSADL